MEHNAAPEQGLRPPSRTRWPCSSCSLSCHACHAQPSSLHRLSSSSVIRRFVGRLVGRFALAAIAASGALASGPLYAEPWFDPVRLGVAAGAGNDAAMARLEARWDMKQDLWATSSQSVRLRLGLEPRPALESARQRRACAWRSRPDADPAPAGRRPQRRVRRSRRRRSRAVTHAGCPNERSSTAFQFGDRVAVGYRFGDALDSELALRLQHYSTRASRNPTPASISSWSSTRRASESRQQVLLRHGGRPQPPCGCLRRHRMPSVRRTRPLRG